MAASLRCEAAIFNQHANSFQAKPNKTKQKGLDLLGFIRPNRDFSMGCGEKNKNSLRPRSSPSAPGRRAGFSPSGEYATDSGFLKGFVIDRNCYRQPGSDCPLKTLVFRRLIQNRPHQRNGTTTGRQECGKPPLFCSDII
jgi:hypothetical protein